MGLPTPEFERTFTASLHEAMAQRITRIVEDEAKKAADETQRRVRQMVGEIVSEVATFYSFEKRGQDLVITVKFPGAKS